MDKVDYKTVLREKQYMKLVCANFINRFGDSLDTVAYMWLVYSITGKASWTAIIYAFNKLPTVLLQPFVGPWIEKLNKKRVMYVVDLIRGFLVLILVVMLHYQMVNKYYLVIFTLITSTVETLRLPSSMVFLSKVLKKEYYRYGVSFNSSVVTCAELIGYACSGILIAQCGVTFVILIDGVTFFGSALLIMLIHAAEEKSKQVSGESYFNRLKKGIGYIKGKRIVLNFCIMAIVVNALLVPFNSMQVPLVNKELGARSSIISIINTLLLVGMIVGSFVTPKITKKLSINQSVLIAGELIGISYICMGLTYLFSEQYVLLLCICVLESFVFGFGISVINTLLSVQFMSCVEEDYLSRVGALFNAGGSGITPIMSWIVGGIAGALRVSNIFLLFGVLCSAFFMLLKLFRLQLQ